jgi:hypothetical protein
MNTLETNDIDDKLSKFGSFADSLSRLLLVENRARFTTSLDVYGNKYEPNSPVWIRRKGNNKPTLGLTGQMRDNITVNPNNKDTIRIFSYMDYSSFVYKRRNFLGVSDLRLSQLIAPLLS